MRVNVKDRDSQMAEIEKAKKAQKARNASTGNKSMMRFKAVRGEESAFIILNKSFDESEWAYEHKLAGKTPTGKFFESYEPCLTEENDCPLCSLALDKDNAKGVKPAQYRFGLTVLPVELNDKGMPTRISHYEYTDNEGKTHKRYSRKFFVVPVSDRNSLLTQFKDRIEDCEANNGDIRGCVIKVVRGNDKVSAVTGEPINFGPGKQYLKLKEKHLMQLLDKSGYEGIKTRDGEVIATRESLIEAVEDYYGQFIEKDENTLRSIYDVNYEAPAEESLDLDDDDDDIISLDDEDDTEAEIKEEPKAKKPTKRKRKAKEEKAEEPEDDDIDISDEAEEEVAEIEDDFEVDDEDDDFLND